MGRVRPAWRTGFGAAATLTVTVMLVSCSTSERLDASTTTWQLESLTEQDGTPVDLDRTRSIFAVIDLASGEFWGHDGCYFYTHLVAVDGDTIDVNTEAFADLLLECSEEAMRHEALLGSVSSYALEGDRLTLQGAGDSEITYAAAELSDIPEPVTDSTQAP